jgi:hypothetical protein
MNQQRTAWNEYFPDSPSTSFSSQTYSSHQSSSSTGVYVLNCLFISITTTSDGAALYCTSTSYFLVESSSFFSCRTSNTWGGSICLPSSNKGQCILHKICSYDCFTTQTSASSGQSLYIYANNSVSSKNYVNYSSLSRSVNVNSGSKYTLYLVYGKICCPSVNISMNKCQLTSGIYCCPSIDPSSVTCSLSYSSLADNNANQNTCIKFNYESAKYEMKCCNILRNAQGTLSSEGTVYTIGILNIDDSCFLMNTATYIFYSASSSYPITLTRCTVDKTSNNGYLTIQNTVTKSFILALNHMSTRNCHSEYDSAGYLTAVSFPSNPTKKEFCFCYTCKVNHYQGRISVYFSINSMLLFTFIHPNPSGDCWYDSDYYSKLSLLIWLYRNTDSYFTNSVSFEEAKTLLFMREIVLSVPTRKY